MIRLFLCTLCWLDAISDSLASSKIKFLYASNRCRAKRSWAVSPENSPIICAPKDGASKDFGSNEKGFLCTRRTTVSALSYPDSAAIYRMDDYK